MDETREPFACELYADLKEANKFKEKVIAWLICVIVLLILALGIMHFYHIYQWSQFETIYVDSQDGGNANYVQGDNTGGIFNGKSDRSPEAEGPLQGD